VHPRILVATLKPTSDPMLGQRLAEAVRRDAGCKEERLLEAFASTPRERFLGPPPWLVARPSSDGTPGPSYAETSDLADLYANVSVALDAPRGLFNGAPGVVAAWLEALNPRVGDRAFHAGCGTGYYTAILAKLVGPSGSVVSVDVNQSLIERARDALVDRPNVSLQSADATSLAPPPYDVGLVNIGVSVIPHSWISALRPRGGRLQVPLAVPLPGGAEKSTLSKGIVLLIERHEEAFSARTIGVAVIFSASGGAYEAAERRLLATLLKGNSHEVQSLRRDSHEPGAACWLHEERYCLSRLRITADGNSGGEPFGPGE
jgi:protein-L-isoaspartate(D-aspartate) O-methyltransferase